MNYWNNDGFSGTIELTEDSSRELLRVLEEQEQVFINKLLDGKCGFTLRGSDGRTVDLVPKALCEWIPCSERKPTKKGHYLCSFKKPHRIDSIYVNLAYWTGSRWYGYLASEINAWMPLPEPWKGADDESVDSN